MHTVLEVALAAFAGARQPPFCDEFLGGLAGSSACNRFRSLGRWPTKCQSASEVQTDARMGCSDHRLRATHQEWRSASVLWPRLPLYSVSPTAVQAVPSKQETP